MAIRLFLLSDEATKTSAMTKQINALKGKLEPKSVFHQKQSEAELRLLAKDVAALAGGLPDSVTASTEWELKTAMEVIFPEPASPKANRKAEKPELVVDFYDYDTY